MLGLLATAALTERNFRIGQAGDRGATGPDVDEDAVPDSIDSWVAFANANQGIPCL